MAKQKQLVQFGAAPRVDLLPQAQREDLRLERSLPRLGLFVVASAALAGLIWTAGSLPTHTANEQLAQAEAESSALVTKIASHADLQKTMGQERDLADQRKKLTETEVMFADRLTELAKLLPSDAKLTGYEGSLVVGDPNEAGVEAVVGMDLNPLCVAESATLLVRFRTETLDPGATFIKKIDEKSVTGFQCIAATKIEKAQKGEPLEVSVQLALGKQALAQRFEEETQ